MLAWVHRSKIRIRPTHVTALSLSLAVCGAASSVGAQEDRRLPISEVNRPLVNPAGTLDIWGSIVGQRAYESASRPALFATITTGLQYSITNDFSIGGRIVGVDIAPASQIEFPSAHARLRLVRGPFQLGLEGGASFFAKQHGSDGNLRGSAGTTLWAGLPMRVIVPRRMKIYLSPQVFTVVRFEHAIPADDTRAGLGVPFSMLFRIVDPLAVGFSSGYGIYRFDRALETSYVPVGFWGVATLPSRKGPALDFGPSFSWPYLFTPGSNVQRINTDVWQVELSVTAFVYDL